MVRTASTSHFFFGKKCRLFFLLLCHSSLKLQICPIETVSTVELEQSRLYYTPVSFPASLFFGSWKTPQALQATLPSIPHWVVPAVLFLLYYLSCNKTKLFTWTSQPFHELHTRLSNDFRTPAANICCILFLVFKFFSFIFLVPFLRLAAVTARMFSFLVRDHTNFTLTLSL